MQRKGLEKIIWLEQKNFQFDALMKKGQIPTFVQAARLGGRFLFQEAFFDQESKDRSKELQLEALNEAKDQLDSDAENPKHVNDVCQDEGQLALWHAIFDHENFESSADACEETFQAFAHAHDLSFPKLQLMKHRWLKEYRSLIMESPAGCSWEHLQIGETHDKGNKWLLGLVYKYRATLLASSQRHDEAIENFEASFQSFESMPGLRSETRFWILCGFDAPLLTSPGITFHPSGLRLQILG